LQKIAQGLMCGNISIQLIPATDDYMS
jgi:hypothetical protein